MARVHVGKVMFADQSPIGTSEFIVMAVPPDGVALDLSFNVPSSSSRGDIEVAFDGVKAQELLRMLTSAVRMAEVGDSIRWERVGSVQYTWSDRDEEVGSPGEILVEVRRMTVRLTIRPNPRREKVDYVAIMSLESFRELFKKIETAIAT